MSALSVSIDGKTIASVCTDKLDSIFIRATGTLTYENLAELDVSGGAYPATGDSVYLIWVDLLPIKPNQIIAVSFDEIGSSSHAGKTIKELYPNETPITDTEFKSKSEMLMALRDKPKFRDDFSFRVASSSGTALSGKTSPDEHFFSFSTIWNSHQPDQISVSVHSNTIDGMETGATMKSYFQEKIKFGGSVCFELLEGK